MATPEGVIQKINLLIEDANDATGSLHNNLRDAVDSLILGYGGYGNIEVDSLSELHTWSKYAIGGTVTETKVDTLGISGDRSGTDSIYEPVDYADEYDISNSKIVLVNPTENLTFTSSTDAQVLLGKYIQTYEIPNKYATAASPSGKFYRIDSTAKVEYSKSVYPTTARSLTASPAYRLEYTGAEDRFVGIVVSDDIDAYPQNGEQDGYKYVYNGTLESEPSLQHKSVTPSTKNQVVLPDTNYDGLSHVTVEGDEDLVAGNIKKGVEIFGVVGNYETTAGVDTSDATLADGQDLLSGVVAYGKNGERVVGSASDKRIEFASFSATPSVFSNPVGTYIMLVDAPTKTTMIRDRVALLARTSEFGDATADDVAAGKTFTSAEGHKVVGTMEPGGGFTVTDDGAGNVTITSSAITDNDGNVVIA